MTFIFSSHLVIATSQEINDVPYGDYFCVQVQAVVDFGKFKYLSLFAAKIECTMTLVLSFYFSATTKK